MMARSTATHAAWTAVKTTLAGGAMALCLLVPYAYGGEKPRPDVLSIGGSVTEIIYALQEAHRLVARDATSTHPDAAGALPDVGYMRALSSEGVLAVSPDLIISAPGAGPPETIALLKASGIEMVTVPDAHDAAGIAAKIRAVGDALGAADKAETLASRIETAMTRAVSQTRDMAGADRKRVVFILSLQDGGIMASGTDTAADAIITLAGGQNALTGFEGYKRITDEALIKAAPDAILIMDRGGDHQITRDALLAMPAIRTTPAGREGQVIRMDGLYLLGFGPRTADAVRDLGAALYGG